MKQGFAIIDKQIAGRPFAAGGTLTIADAAPFYVERWAPQVEIDLPPHVQAHFDRMLARSSVQTVLAIWVKSDRGRSEV